MELEGLIIQFDFNSIITVKNQSKDEKNEENEEKSFEHIILLHKRSREILIEPLVAVYLNLKWQSLKVWWFAYRLLFFLAFGVCLTLLISFIVEMNSHCNFATEVSNKTVIGEVLEKKWAMFKKQGTSGLPEVTDNIYGTQSCMCCEATNAAEKVSS